MSQTNSFNPDLYLILEELISDQIEILFDEVKFILFIEKNNLNIEITNLIKLSFNFDLPNIVYKIITKNYYSVNELESLIEIIIAKLEIHIEKAEQLLELLLYLLDKNSLVEFYFDIANKIQYSNNYEDTIKATELLQRSVSLIPDNKIETYELLGDLYHYKINDSNKALFNFNLVYSKDPEFKDINLKLGQIYHFDFKDYDTAISYYNKEIELYPETELTYSELIKLYKRTENSLKLEESIRRFIFTISNELSFKYLYEYFNNYEKIIYFSNSEVEEIIFKHYKSNNILLKFADYLMLIQNNYSLSSKLFKHVIININYFYRPESLIKEKYYSDYSECYEKAIINYTFLNVIYFKNIKALVKLYFFDSWLKTIFCVENDKSEESIEKEVYDVMPLVKNHLVNLFYCFPDEFSKVLDCFYPIKNKFDFLFQNMKKFSISIENILLEEKIKIPTTYIEKDYSLKFHKNNEYRFENYYSEYFYKKAIKMEESYKYKEAILYINLAILSNQNYEFYYFMRGKYYYNLSNYEKAIIDFKKSIKLDPKSEYGYIWKGYSNYELEKYEEAIIDFSNSIKINPFKEVGYEYRAKARFKVKDYYGCINDCDFLINKNIDLSTYLILRGKSYLCIRNKKKGFNDLSKASELGDKEAFDLIKYYSEVK